MQTVPTIMTVSLTLGLAAGYVMHRSDYCIAGMFRDFFLFRKTFMLRTLLLLIVTSMGLYEGARLMGLLRPYPFPLVGAPSLSNVAGGFIFGIGMVMAGGCVVGTLYKMGAGKLVSLMAFGGLVAGSVLYAEIHPWWARFKGATVLVEGKVTVPQLLGVSPSVLAAAVAVPAVLLFLRWGRDGGWERPAAVEGYLQPWKAALVLSLIGLASWAAIGMPMGITTAYSKWGALVERLFAPGHVEALAYLSAQPLDYPHPWTGARLQGGAGPSWDAIAAIQYPLIAGVVLGSAFSALRLGEFRIYGAPSRQLISGVAGGFLMGMASRMAPSCNVWHLLGGVPIFALQSLLFAAGLIPGAWVGTKVLVNHVISEGKR